MFVLNIWYYPDLAKSFYRQLPFFLHLPMDDSHSGYIKKIPKENLE
jgi:hypothetical protein